MIPNLLWKKKIPDKLPGEMEAVINKLKKIKNKEKLVRKVYSIVTKRYHGCYIYNDFFKLFLTDMAKFWKSKGAMHCTNMNYLMRIFLIKSKVFKEDDIKLKLTLVDYCSIHQYLKIRINNKKTICADPWGEANGIRFGDYAQGPIKR